VKTLSRTETVEFEVAVENVPDLKGPYHKALVIRPNRAYVTFIDGKRHNVVISGPRVLKNGILSDNGNSVTLHDFDWDNWPDWVHTLIHSLEGQM
jgi:hypothetical protein